MVVYAHNQKDLKPLQEPTQAAHYLSSNDPNSLTKQNQGRAHAELLIIFLYKYRATFT